MKKLGTLSVMFACILSACMLSACSLFEYSDWLTKNQKEITDEAMLRICRAIRTHDTDAVKATFASDDVAGVENFDESVDKLLDYVAGVNPTARFVASGSDGAGMGSYPKDRTFGGVNYDIETSTDKYKVIFGYRSYYSPKVNVVDENKIGFTYFDIINVKNDREHDHRYYSGDPERHAGINFDHPTLYSEDYGEYAYKKAYCSYGETFDPVIINDVAELAAFRAKNGDRYALDARADGKSFVDVASEYDSEFFGGHSLYIVGMYNDGGGYMYVPQWLYIGDFVTTYIASFEYETHRGEYAGDFPENGVIFFVELPVKVPSDFDARIIRD